MSKAAAKNIQASIIIPTHNRARILKKVIESLSKQTYPADRFEVIIVDDGSTDNTGDVIRSVKVPYDLQYFKQRKEGTSAARNYGIGKARGDIIMFIDSDILVDRYFVEEHIRSHRQGDSIIVKGVVINTENIDDPAKEKMKLSDVSTAFFATGNVSIGKRHLIEAGLFDEDFKEYGWEDLELGMRLKKQGLRVTTNKRALGYHWKRRVGVANLPELCLKERMRGRTAVLFYSKHPTFEVACMTHLNLFFFGLDRLLNVGNWTNTSRGRDFLLWLEKNKCNTMVRFLTKLITSHCYIEGVREGLKTINE